MPLPPSSSKKKIELPVIDNTENIEQRMSEQVDKQAAEQLTKKSAINEGFESLSVEEQARLDSEEESKQERRSHSKVPRKSRIPKLGSGEPLFDKNADDDKFIDKKNKKIIPIGKKKARASDFDSRKNTLVTVKLIRAFVFIFFVILFGLGIKNTFFPEQIYTPREIEQIATSAVGDSGFPTETGAAFAEEFLKYYMTSDLDDPVNRRIVNRFYGVKAEGVAAGSNRTIFADTKQRVLSDPIMFDSLTVFPYAGAYKFSMLVSDSDGSMANEDGKLSAYWISVLVNVYYNAETKEFAVHKDSPTLIPTYAISSQTDIPTDNPLGNGDTNDEMLPILTPTIDGFIVAYAKADIHSHNEIVQYIPDSRPVDLISGFGDEVELAKDTKSSIRKTVYNTDTPNEWKADISVEWASKQSSERAMIFKSRYVMTIKKTADDVYLVTKFLPYIYIKEIKEN